MQAVRRVRRRRATHVRGQRADLAALLRGHAQHHLARVLAHAEDLVEHAREQRCGRERREAQPGCWSPRRPRPSPRRATPRRPPRSPRRPARDAAACALRAWSRPTARSRARRRPCRAAPELEVRVRVDEARQQHRRARSSQRADGCARRSAPASPTAAMFSPPSSSTAPVARSAHRLVARDQPAAGDAAHADPVQHGARQPVVAHVAARARGSRAPRACPRSARRPSRTSCPRSRPRSPRTSRCRSRRRRSAARPGRRRGPA